MSTVNLSDPQVLQNFIRAQVIEGKGDYEVHEEALIFKATDGSTFIVPGDLGTEVMDKIRAKAKVVKKADKKIETVAGKK